MESFEKIPININEELKRLDIVIKEAKESRNKLLKQLKESPILEGCYYRYKTDTEPHAIIKVEKVSTGYVKCKQLSDNGLVSGIYTITIDDFKNYLVELDKYSLVAFKIKAKRYINDNILIPLNEF